MCAQTLQLPKINLLGDFFISCVSRGVQVDVKVSNEERLESLRLGVASFPDELELC
jgi:hypothetical protein